MPLDFPSSPFDGDTFTSAGKVWVYVASINAWEPKPQAVAWNDLTGTLDSVQFDLTPTTATFAVGETKWNAAEGCLSYGVEGGDISIGKEIWENYTDLDGDMVEGDVVSIVGASGNRSAVRKTNATDAASAAAVFGMVTNVNADNTVRITEFGRVHKLNTNGYSEGAMLYVNPAANGKWTITKPTAPNYAVEVGVIEVAHSVNGVVGVRCRSVTFPSANIIDLSSATVGALSFGATTEAVSMSLVAGVATFTFGANAKAAFLTAVGAMASTGGTMTNGTISGTLAINSTSYTFGTGAGDALWNALGGTLSGAKSFSGQIELTGQAATNATSAMNRALTQTEIAKAKAFEIPAGNSYTFKITGQSFGVTFGASGSGIDINARSFSTQGGLAIVGTGISGWTENTATATTVASLGTATAYRMRWVSDALTPTIGATVTGGGAVKVLVAGNGTNWIVIAII